MKLGMADGRHGTQPSDQAREHSNVLTRAAGHRDAASMASTLWEISFRHCILLYSELDVTIDQ